MKETKKSKNNHQQTKYILRCFIVTTFPRWNQDAAFCHCVIVGGFVGCYGCSGANIPWGVVTNESEPLEFIIFKSLLQLFVAVSQRKINVCMFCNIMKMKTSNFKF